MNGISKFIGSTVCAGALLFVAGQVSATNLVLNPGFETGSLTNWTVLGAGVGASVVAATPDNGPSAPGSFNAFMTNSIAASNLALQQSTAAGDAVPGTVNYSLDLKVVNSAVGGVVFIHIWDINATGGVIDQGPGLLGPYFNTSWATISGHFTAPSNVDHLEVEIDCTTGAGAGSAEAVSVDNVSLTQAVPEPTTVALVGIGLFGAVALGRKRKS
jgi:PEP-CTERM motif